MGCRSTKPGFSVDKRPWIHGAAGSWLPLKPLSALPRGALRCWARHSARRLRLLSLFGSHTARLICLQRLWYYSVRRIPPQYSVACAISASRTSGHHRFSRCLRKHSSGPPVSIGCLMARKARSRLTRMNIDNFKQAGYHRYRRSGAMDNKQFCPSTYRRGHNFDHFEQRREHPAPVTTHFFDGKWGAKNVRVVGAPHPSTRILTGNTEKLNASWRSLSAGQAAHVSWPRKPELQPRPNLPPNSSLSTRPGPVLWNAGPSQG